MENFINYNASSCPFTPADNIFAFIDLTKSPLDASRRIGEKITYDTLYRMPFRIINKNEWIFVDSKDDRSNTENEKLDTKDYKKD